MYSYMFVLSCKQLVMCTKYCMYTQDSETFRINSILYRARAVPYAVNLPNVLDFLLTCTPWTSAICCVCNLKIFNRPHSARHCTAPSCSKLCRRGPGYSVRLPAPGDLRVTVPERAVIRGKSPPNDSGFCTNLQRYIVRIIVRNHCSCSHSSNCSHSIL